MKNLLLPISGKSTRFPNMRPKFLLTHPNGNFMLIEAIKCLDLSYFDMIYIICLKEHIEKFKFEKGLNEQLNDLGISNFNITIIDSSDSQPETIYKCIIKNNISGSLCIKDCDNSFNIDIIDENFVSGILLDDINNKINIKNKNYLKINNSNYITNIVEKKIISNTFGTGMYYFENCIEYLVYYEKNSSYKDLYLSHIIFDMILHGINFKVNYSSNYLDWGTLSDWDNYINEFKTIFIDLDGVLVENSSEYFEPIWGTTKKIEENVKIINDLYNSGKCKIIITTSRKIKYYTETINQLKRENILYHQILFDMNHNKRYLINDYSKTNKYPTSIAINLERNSKNLNDYI